MTNNSFSVGSNEKKNLNEINDQLSTAGNNQAAKVVKGVFWRFLERISAQGVSFVVSIILARMLSPDDYGIVAIVSIFIAIAEIFVTSGLGTALIQKKSVTQKEFSVMFWCNLALSAIIYAIFFGASPLISSYFEMPILTNVLRILAFRIPISAINSIQHAWISRCMDFKKLFFSTIIGTIISAIIGIYMAFTGFGVWALVVQILANSFIDTFILFYTIKWIPTFIFSISIAKPLLSYGWKILATDLIGTIFNYLNSFAIGKRYSSVDLAFYTQGKKFTDLIESNVGSSLASVLFPAMSLSKDYESIINMRRKCLKVLGFIMIPIFMGLFAVADNFVFVFLTDKWLPIVKFIRIYCVVSVLNLIGTTLIQETKAIGKSDMTLKMELLKKPIYIMLLVFAISISVDAIAYISIIYSVVCFIFNLYPVKKYIGFSIKLHMIDLLPSLFISLSMSACVYQIGLFIQNHLCALIVQIFSGIFIYITLSAVTKNDVFIFVFRNLKKLLQKDNVKI